MTRITTPYEAFQIVIIFYKALFKRHVEYCSWDWGLYYEKDTELLEELQHGYT